MFYFLRNPHIIFHCFHFTSPSAMHKSSKFSTSSPTLDIFCVCVCVCVYITPNLTDAKKYLFVFLIFIFLIISDVENLSRRLLVICISSLQKCLFRSFVHFDWVVCFLFLLGCRSYLYSLDINLIRYMIYKYFLSLWVAFTMLIEYFDLQSF